MRRLCASSWIVFVALTYAMLSLNTLAWGQQTNPDPSDSNYYLKKGFTLMNNGHFLEAISVLTSALENKPNSVTALTQRSRAYLLTGQTSKALEDINNAIYLSSSNSELYKLRADTLSTLGDHKSAVSDYNRAINLSPNSSSAFNNRAVALANLNKNKEALEDLNAAMEISLTSPNTSPPSVFEGSKW
ncbi:MAG: tetratricopeptide repeat protein [Pseudomonadota bacterium]